MRPKHKEELRDVDGRGVSRRAGGGTPAVLEGLKAVRRSGAHMVERPHVLVVAKRMGYRQTVRWVEEHPDDYARGIVHGFEAAPEEEE